MNLQITSSALWGMIDAMDDTIPVEQCAVLYGRVIDGVTEVLAFEFVPNRHPHPEDAYRIHLTDIAERHRKWVVGVFHTHLEGHDIGPSSVDVALIQPGHVGIVYHIPTGTLSYFDTQQNEGKK